MIPAAFEYARAGSVDHAIELLAARDAKLLAGGQSLIPRAPAALRAAVGARRRRPARRPPLRARGRRPDRDRRAHPARRARRSTRCSPRHCAVIPQAAAHIGDPQVRHRGTIGGSVAHADPASDLGTILLTLDAELVARGPGRRADDPGHRVLHRPVRDRARAAGDAHRDPRAEGRGGHATSSTCGARPDWATVGVAAARVNGACRSGSPSMGMTPLRARAVEEALAGGASPADAAAHAAEGTEPPERRRARSSRVPRAPRAGARPPRPRAALSSMLTVAVLGLGEAGSRLAADLAAAGVDVRGYDPARAGGAPDPETAVAGADVVLSVNARRGRARRRARPRCPRCGPARLRRPEHRGAGAEARARGARRRRGARFADVALLGPVPARGLAHAGARLRRRRAARSPTRSGRSGCRSRSSRTQAGDAAAMKLAPLRVHEGPRRRGDREPRGRRGRRPRRVAEAARSPR